MTRSKRKAKSKAKVAMKIESIDIIKLVEDPANARRHGERNIEIIKRSLARFGQQKPIVVDAKNVVRAGNGTLVAARALGWKKIDVIRTKLVDGEATAYSIADNRSGDPAVGSEWDNDALALALIDLKDAGVGLDDLGFTAEDLDQLIQGIGPHGPDGFKEFDESIKTEYQCPKCGYEWSGKPGA